MAWRGEDKARLGMAPAGKGVAWRGESRLGMAGRGTGGWQHPPNLRRNRMDDKPDDQNDQEQHRGCCCGCCLLYVILFIIGKLALLWHFA